MCLGVPGVPGVCWIRNELDDAWAKHERYFVNELENRSPSPLPTRRADAPSQREGRGRGEGCGDYSVGRLGLLIFASHISRQ